MLLLVEAVTATLPVTHMADPFDDVEMIGLDSPLDPPVGMEAAGAAATLPAATRREAKVERIVNIAEILDTGYSRLRSEDYNFREIRQYLYIIDHSPRAYFQNQTALYRPGHPTLPHQVVGQRRLLTVSGVKFSHSVESRCYTALTTNAVACKHSK